MKLMQHISLLTFIFILFSCSSNDDGGNEIDANRPSSCINATEFGFLQEINMRLLQFGDFTALVYVLTARLPGLPVSVSASVSVAPTNEFENVVMDVFFPLSYQLLVSDRDTLSDRDQDGVPDIFDTDPDNPNVQ